VNNLIKILACPILPIVAFNSFFKAFMPHLQEGLRKSEEEVKKIKYGGPFASLYSIAIQIYIFPLTFIPILYVIALLYAAASFFDFGYKLINK
jgi:hypothetical protein